MIITAQNANKLWYDAASALVHIPYVECNPDEAPYELINCSLQLTNPLANCMDRTRHMNMVYAAAELEWYDMKTRDVSFIGQYSTFWQGLADNKNEVNSNYGWCIHKKYGFDQWTNCIELLKRDKKTRRAIIHIKEPLEMEGLYTDKDINCTLTLQFLIRNNVLDMIVNMRSNDIWYGLPYDVYYFTTLQQRMSEQLDVSLGTYYHNAGSLHMYQRNRPKIEQNLNDTRKDYGCI